MSDARQVESLMRYPDDTAGGRMTPGVLSLREEESAQSAIDNLRRTQPDSEVPYYLFVTDASGALKGVLGLRDLITAKPEASLRELVKSTVYSIKASEDQEQAAKLMRRYNLLLLPVTDDSGHLIGAIHSKDLVQVIEEENTEDIYRLAGVSTDGQLQVWSPIRVSIRRRLPWLGINLLTAFLAAGVVSIFEGTIAQLALLAVFQGIIAGQGGNAATQSLAIMVRAIALGEVQFSDLKRALMRELKIGAINGLAIGIAVGLGAWAWKDQPLLGLLVAISMFGNMIAAGLAGTAVPLILRSMKLDPALASAVLVTTVTDCVGFGLFLWLATLSMPYLIG
jgi:magnesium transporter